MSRDSENAVMAFRNAWLGAVTSAGELQKMAPAVEALPADTPVTALDFYGYHRCLLYKSYAADGRLGRYRVAPDHLKKKER